MKRATWVFVCFFALLAVSCREGLETTLFPVSEGSKSGYIDASGQIAIPLEFAMAEPFSEGLAAVLVSGRGVGYINSKGKIVIEPQYIRASEFHEGMAMVETGDGSAFINRDGDVVIKAADPPVNWKFAGSILLTSFSSPEDVKAFSADGLLKITGGSSFSEGFALVTVGENLSLDLSAGTFSGEVLNGYIDKSGVLLPHEPHGWFGMSSLPFSEGLAAVKFEGKFGFIDTTGKYAIESQFDRAYSFSQGLAPARVGGKWGYIDPSGDFLIEPQYDDAQTFDEGLAAAAAKGAWGYIDTQGIAVIEFQFENASRFSQGLAAVQIDGKWGYVDSTGNIIVPPQFERAEPFTDGLAAVRFQGQRCYIDRAGHWVWRPVSEGH